MARCFIGSGDLHHDYCERCKDLSFFDLSFKCIDCKWKLGTISTTIARRVAEGSYIRKGPSADFRLYQIKLQGRRCYWCNLPFGTWMVNPKKHKKMLEVVWDHYVPYSYTGSCIDEEFVASCQICNGCKHSKSFTEESDTRAYLRDVVRRVKGWRVHSFPKEEPSVETAALPNEPR